MSFLHDRQVRSKSILLCEYFPGWNHARSGIYEGPGLSQLPISYGRLKYWYKPEYNYPSRSKRIYERLAYFPINKICQHVQRQLSRPPAAAPWQSRFKK
jgi:hypothetical protein